jgi:hypothetical protein
MSITMDTFTTKGYTPKHIIPPCKECTMHTPINNPMLRAISTITKGVGGYPQHDLHTSARADYGQYVYTPMPNTTTYHCYVCDLTYTNTTPTHVCTRTRTTPTTHTPTKEYIPMHYKATLNTRTTMAWLVLTTIHVLLYKAALTYIPLPTWGGIHTLLTVGMYMSMGGTAIAALTYRYVRKHGPVTLSTRDLGL